MEPFGPSRLSPTGYVLSGTPVHIQRPCRPNSGHEPFARIEWGAETSHVPETVGCMRGYHRDGVREFVAGRSYGASASATEDRS